MNQNNENKSKNKMDNDKKNKKKDLNELISYSNNHIKKMELFCKFVVNCIFLCRNTSFTKRILYVIPESVKHIYCQLV